jgi:hypothetical protein
LEHNNFTRKSAIIIEPMLIYLSNKHNWIKKYKEEK